MLLELGRHPNTPFESPDTRRVIVDHLDTVIATAFLNPGCPEQLLESALQGHWPESMDVSFKALSFCPSSLGGSRALRGSVLRNAITAERLL